MEINREVSEKNLFLEVHWCPSNQQQADDISRLDLGALTPDHWPRLSDFGVKKLLKIFKPDVHIFGWPGDARSIAAKYSSLHFDTSDPANLQILPLSYLTTQNLANKKLFISPDLHHESMVLRIIKDLKNVESCCFGVLLSVDSAYQTLKFWSDKPNLKLSVFAHPKDKPLRRSLAKKRSFAYYLVCFGNFKK